jgi:hypothetical protein
MFERLQQKWKVNGWRLLLILITFAVGGSLCGYLGRLILNQLSISQSVIRIILYIVLVTILWPFCVLLISILTGQFFFFRSYLKKMGRRLSGRKEQTGDKLIMNTATKPQSLPAPFPSSLPAPDPMQPGSFITLKVSKTSRSASSFAINRKQAY